MKRRDAIKTLGTLAGAASLSRILPACGSDEFPITTMVFMMMENRSYDHYFGSRSWLAGKPGDGLTADMTNPNGEGQPVGLWQATDETMCVPADPPHGWDAARLQFNGGLNDGFVLAQQEERGGSGIEPMQYMAPEQLPTYTALADAYTSCDRWFSSLLGPTLPNRMYWHAGTSNHATANREVLEGAFEEVLSIHHQLNRASVDWAYYYGDVPVLSVLDIEETRDRLHPFWLFLEHAAAGTLPPVVHIDPAFLANDDHPPHHPLLGQQLVTSVYQALATSPQWKNCLLVVAYDENGGFFDHVPPPTAADDLASEGFGQLGFRVPALVAGPYAKTSYVSSVQYDHTSPLKHIAQMFQLDPLTARSSAANDLTDCLDLERIRARRPADPIVLPAIEVDEDQVPASCFNDLLSSRSDHEIVLWAQSSAGRRRLGDLDRRRDIRDYVYGIGDYLDRHGLGRIRRRR